VAAKRKSWADKRAGAKPPHVTVLEKAFAGTPAGARLFIASPLLLEEWLGRIPRGQAMDAVALRAELAREHGADATCPVTTGIFLRIVAEAALERREMGAPVEELPPFWRVIAPGSPLAAKLSCGAAGVAALRAAEGIG
jgi:hypothetical protein